MKSTRNLSTQKPKLFLGLPTYGGQRYNTVALIGAIQSQQSFSQVNTMEVDSSLLASAFNTLLINALNYRDQGKADWFLLLHADIMPTDVTGWLDILWKTRCSVDADVISAVSPIKDSRGVTSTSLETPNLYAPRRLTMREIAEQEETFTDDRLLINTGMLMFNLRLPWLDDICFTIGDKILRLDDGTRVVGVTPEDWDFSRQVKKHGTKLWATRAVKLVHVGRFQYPNYGIWGTEDVDPGDVANKPLKKDPLP